MKATKLSLNKQIKLVEKTQKLCNEIILLQDTSPKKRNSLLRHIALQKKVLKRDIKLLLHNASVETKKEESQLKRNFKSLKKLCTQLNINMSDKSGKELDIYTLKKRVTQKKSYLVKKLSPKIEEDYLPLINQIQLKKQLGLSKSAFQYLEDTNVLQRQKIQGRVYYSHTSINNFRKTFDIDDYYTIGECKKILDTHEFYDVFALRMSIPKFDFSITVIQLINTKRSEYKLSTKKIGDTVYITKKSMDRCITNLKILENKLFPTSTTENFTPVKTTKGKSQTNKGNSVTSNKIKKLNPFSKKFRKMGRP